MNAMTASAWTEDPDERGSWCRNDVSTPDLRATGAWSEDFGGFGWMVWTLGGEDIVASDTAYTLPEAQAAADEHAVRAGWALTPPQGETT